MTIRDVARAAGVSTSTVSYVLSGKRPVSAETRRRVEHFVAELGYHPHAGARALASKRSHIIALVVPLRTDVYVPVMMEIATYVTMTARKHGYDVLLITNDEGPDGIRRSCEGTYESTAGALGHILSDRPGTTGFVVQNERALGPLLHLLRTRGRIVPDKASVIALCPERLADQYAPALTAVTGAAKELGRIAVEQVISRIFASGRDRRPDDELVLLAPTLTVRESTGPVRLSDPS
ncbi:LacI family DNA-binding transcriptional regulator [Sphaerisporangium sp. NPDC005288]|uniref:LacI family DNA-binding transcriptional regulator n=1 Tax=Sphaerisporangium sp. NPDC005288 TaxID=3155114 RepID=UPI0033AF5B51